MNAVARCRLLALGLTLPLTLGAVWAGVAAVLTPEWQVVNLPDFQNEHHHGLWLDCSLGKKHVQGNSYHCTYKFEDIIGGGADHELHKFHDFHKATLCFLGAAVLCGFIAFTFLICAACVRVAAIVANVLLLAAAILSVVGLTVFFVCSHKAQYRFVNTVAVTYEQGHGYSYWLAVGSSLAYICAFLCSLLLTVLIFLHDRNEHRSNKTFPKENTAV